MSITIDAATLALLNAGKDATVTLTIVPPPPATAPLVATYPATDALTVGSEASLTLTITGGVAPYTVTATGLPPGMAVSGTTITGTPTTAGSSQAKLTIKDSSGEATQAAIVFTVTGTPVVTPTPPAGLPQTGPGVIYNGAVEGKELWPGDWSGGGVTEDYNAVVDGLTCLTVTANDAYPYWLPFAPLGGPNGTTPTYDPTNATHLVIIMKPTGGNNDTLNVGCYTYKVVDGVVQGDVPTSSGVKMNQYAMSTDPNGFITYMIPKEAIGAVNPVYKIIVQDASTPVGESFAVHYAAFV